MANSRSVSRSTFDLIGLLASLFLFLGLFAIPLDAQTNSTWNGGTGNWSDTSNWNNGAPNGDYNALISNGNPGVSTANLDINATVANLSLDSGNTLNILAGNTLTFQSASGSTATGGGIINLASGGGIVVGSGNSLSVDCSINMSGPNSFITGSTGAESILINSVAGSGTISNLQVTVGSITADGGTLTINPNSQGVTIGNNLNVTQGSTLNITGGPFNNFAPTTRTLSNIGAAIGTDTGVYLQGTLKFDNANILQLGASPQNLTLDRTGAQIVNQNNQNALSNLNSLGRFAQLSLLNGAALSTSGDLSLADQSSLLVANGSALKVGGTLNVFGASSLGQGVDISNSLMMVGGNVNSSGNFGDSMIAVTNGGTNSSLPCLGSHKLSMSTG